MGITSCPICHSELVVISTTTTQLVDPLLTLNALGVWQAQIASARVLSHTLDVRCSDNHTGDQIRDHVRNAAAHA